MKIFDPKLTGSIEILNEITGDVTMSANLLVEGNLSGNITGSASTASYIELSNVEVSKVCVVNSAVDKSQGSGRLY